MAFARAVYRVEGRPPVSRCPVVASIYAGIATPTEAASLGVIAALLLAAWEWRVSLSMQRAVAEGTMQTTAHDHARQPLVEYARTIHDARQTDSE